MTPMLVSNWTTGLPPFGAVSAPEATPHASSSIAANHTVFRIGTPRIVLVSNLFYCNRNGSGRDGPEPAGNSARTGYLLMMVGLEGATGPSLIATHARPSDNADCCPV